MQNGKNLEISCLYRSHDLLKTEFIYNLNQFLKSKEKIKNHYVIGDFNIDILDQNNLSLEFLNNFLEKEYVPTSTEITRPSENKEKGKVKICYD